MTSAVRASFTTSLQRFQGDCFFDVMVPTTHLIPPGSRGYMLPLQFSASPERPLDRDGHGYFLALHPALATSPLRLSTGIVPVDKDDVREIVLAFDHIDPFTASGRYLLAQNTPVARIYMPSYAPFRVDLTTQPLRHTQLLEEGVGALQTL